MQPSSRGQSTAPSKVKGSRRPGWVPAECPLSVLMTVYLSLDFRASPSQPLTTSLSSLTGWPTSNLAALSVQALTAFSSPSRSVCVASSCLAVLSLVDFTVPPSALLPTWQDLPRIVYCHGWDRGWWSGGAPQWNLRPNNGGKNRTLSQDQMLLGPTSRLQGPGSGPGCRVLGGRQGSWQG